MKQDDICKVKSVYVNFMPEGCGQCSLMYYLHDVTPVCAAIPQEKFEIEGNPYNMSYRRSDCPLIVDDD